ncbi:50S ribosomal protein L29 [Candidatus Parcubacteria bacterium]|nr:MAG: 50S ribosomal protein L29 [Candidatus Parcubacteria bacterium]
MKRKEVEELKRKPPAELEKLLRESRERLRILRFDLAAGKVKNTRELQDVRKYVARIETFLRTST